LGHSVDMKIKWWWGLCMWEKKSFSLCAEQGWHGGLWDSDDGIRHTAYGALQSDVR